MSIDDTKGQLSQQMDALQKSWGLSADYSNESLSNGDILQQCSIGAIATISKLKPRQMQAFADSTSALGLRVVGVLSKLLEQQVKSPLSAPCCATSRNSAAAIFKRNCCFSRPSQDAVGRRRAGCEQLCQRGPVAPHAQAEHEAAQAPGGRCCRAGLAAYSLCARFGFFERRWQLRQ